MRKFVRAPGLAGNSLMEACRNREKIWSAMSDGEKEHYVKTTTDKGNKRLDFRFAH